MKSEDISATQLIHAMNVSRSCSRPKRRSSEKLSKKANERIKKQNFSLNWLQNLKPKAHQRRRQKMTTTVRMRRNSEVRAGK